MQNNDIDVKEFYRFVFDELISIVGINDQGYVVNINNEIEKKNDKPLRVYDIAIEDTKNVEIINPLAETIGKVIPEGNRYFYTALALGLKLKIMQVIAGMGEALESEISDKDKSTAIINFVSKFKDFDNKMVEEIKTIIQDLSMALEFVNVYYNSNKREAIFRTIVFENNFIEKYRKEYKVRKKTLVFLVEFMKTFLNTNDTKGVEKFRAKATSLKCPMLQSILTVYYLIYSAANPVLQLFDLEVNVEKLKYFIDNIDAYSDKARWLTPQTQPAKQVSHHQRASTETGSKLQRIFSQTSSSMPKFMKTQSEEKSSGKLEKIIRSSGMSSLPVGSSYQTGYSYGYAYHQVGSQQPINQYYQQTFGTNIPNRPIQHPVGQMPIRKPIGVKI